MDKPPDPPQITPSDPRLDAERARADADNIRAVQVQAQGDTASLMARYGARLSLANAGGGTPENIAAMGSGPGGFGTGPTFGTSLLSRASSAAALSLAMAAG